MKKIIMYGIFLCCLVFLIIGCSNQNQIVKDTNATAIENPASKKCVDDGGSDKILTATDGSQYGLCMFNDGSVCEEWAYFNGKCKKGICFRTCEYIDTRSEGWYDCNNKLLFWDKCANETAATAATC